MPGIRRQTMHVGLQDRIRDPALTTLLVLELCLIFLAAPLAAKGVAIAKLVIETMVFATVAIVVMLSPRRVAVAAILVGLAAILTSLSLDVGSSPITPRVLHWSGDIVTFLALIWVVAHSVYAPGPNYISPAARCGGAVPECRDHLYRGVQPHLGVEPRRVRRCVNRQRRPR